MAPTYRVGEKVKIHKASTHYHAGNKTGVIRSIAPDGRSARVSLDSDRVTVEMPILNIEKL